MDERAIRARALGANVTGVFSDYDARATVEAALTLHPGTRQVVVVGGTSRLDRGYIDVVREDLRALASPAAITYITDKPLDDVLAAVAALRDDAVVLFLSMQSDGDGVARTGPEALAAMRRVATVPIYGMSANLLGNGIVGGVLFDAAQSCAWNWPGAPGRSCPASGANDLVPIAVAEHARLRLARAETLRRR